MWDSLIILLLIYTGSLVPYFICFIDTVNDIHFAFDILVDLSFFIDIVLNFNTAQEDKNGKYEVRKRKLAMNYLKSYFILDIVTTIPW